MLTFMSWNMNQRASAWSRVEALMSEHGVAAALLQEARQPTELPELHIHPTVNERDRWRIAVPRRYRDKDGHLFETKRWFASAVVGGPGQRIVPREPTELHDVVDGDFACSHPGQFAVADLTAGDSQRITVISLYGIWDRMVGSRELYAESTLHRAISDLAIVFQERGDDHILLAGDLNIYSYTDGTAWGDRAMTVLSRLAAYDLQICGPFRADGEPRLAGCPCPDPDCRHVQTYQYRPTQGRPHQLDFFFATPALRQRLVASWADADPGWREHSDHRAIFATFDLGG